MGPSPGPWGEFLGCGPSACVVSLAGGTAHESGRAHRSGCGHVAGRREAAQEPSGWASFGLGQPRH
eukprot:7704588-Karenia_brevis.AAC.1